MHYDVGFYDAAPAAPAIHREPAADFRIAERDAPPREGAPRANDFTLVEPASEDDVRKGR